jgi:hypothetical protein
MHAKSLLLIVTLALVSLVGWGRPVAQAATQMTSPLSTGQNSAPAGPVCAPAPVLNPAKWGPPDPSLITPATATNRLVPSHLLQWSDGCPGVIVLVLPKPRWFRTGMIAQGWSFSRKKASTMASCA